jgi:DNA adenine methylase
MTKIRTPLRYPGGKSRAVKHILPFIPPDCGELCSPFLGGASVEIAYALQNPTTPIYGYDIFTPIVWFWSALLQDRTALADAADLLRKEEPDFILNKKQVRGLTRDDFLQFRKDVLREVQAGSYSRASAAKVYAINRSSFSGATFSGGYSRRSAFARFTDSSIRRLRNFKVPNLRVATADFKVSLAKHPNAYLYCDPPYKLKEGADILYGVQGKGHTGFDHQGLFEILKDRSGWLLSYNDCEWVRQTYSSFSIQPAAWSYGMKNIGGSKIGDSSELLIKG